MEERIKTLLKTIIHPEINNNIVDSGILKTISVKEKTIEVVLEFRKKIDPVANLIKNNIEELLKSEFPNYVPVIKNLTKSTESEKYNSLDKVKNIVAVASTKGGVGKSTVTVSLATTLSMNGYSIGLLDADIYGPSIPKMLGVEKEKPHLIEGEIPLIEPIIRFGIKTMSIGFFIEVDQSLIWRGPMATNALKQLIENTNWGELDILFIDLPPSTGDIHITLIQTIPVTGVVIITTPQEVALSDVIKGANMFRHEEINVPILGIIENMSWFTPAELPMNKYYIFGKGGGEKLARRYNVPLLGQIPLIQSICEAADKGIPIVNSHCNEAIIFRDIADKLIHALEERNKNLPPTKVVKIKK
ncbi:MAG: Mrp/NBP35 family ATP-binding protein [Bacteroidales bacterium]|nr:Mrp/NBP35 family ATP-binding protein [Bacteroidales bacterium]